MLQEVLITSNNSFQTTSLSVLHNYLDISIKLFSDLYLVNFYILQQNCSFRIEENISLYDYIL